MTTMNYFKSFIANKINTYMVLAIFTMLLISVLPVHAGGERGPYFTLTGSMDIFEDMTLTGQDQSFNTAIVNFSDRPLNSLQIFQTSLDGLDLSRCFTRKTLN